MHILSPCFSNKGQFDPLTNTGTRFLAKTTTDNKEYFGVLKFTHERHTFWVKSS